MAHEALSHERIEIQRSLNENWGSGSGRTRDIGIINVVVYRWPTVAMGMIYIFRESSQILYLLLPGLPKGFPF